MKASILTIIMALCLVSVPALEASATANESVKEFLNPAKKKTTKKSTKKNTSTKAKTSGTNKSTASQTAKVNNNAAVQPGKVAASEANNLKEEEKQNNSSSNTGSSLLSGVLSAISGNTSSSKNASSTSSSIISSLTSIFDASKIASKKQIVGTWTYTEPAVVFSSSNVLKNIGGKVASETVEKQLQTQFEKLGIKQGAMTMTFDNDGNFTQSVGSKTMSGTYTVNGKNVTLKYAGGVQQFVGTTQIDGSDLLIVMDASKLLKYANTIGSLTGNTALKTAGSLLGSMDGMQVGLKLNK